MTINEIIKAGEDFCKMIFEFSLEPPFSKSDAFFINSLGYDVSSIVNRIASITSEYQSDCYSSNLLFDGKSLEILKKKYRDTFSVKESDKHFLLVHSDPKNYSNIEIFERTDFGDRLAWSGHISNIPGYAFPSSELFAAELSDIIPYKGDDSK